MGDNDNYQIRTASVEDVKWITSMADSEGWNPGKHDATIFHQIDPTGFFIGTLNGKRIGCISGVKYEDTGYSGYYVVDKEYRHKNYGQKLTEHALKYMNTSKYGCDAVVAQQENYNKYFGLRPVHENMRYVGCIKGKSAADCKEIVKASSIPFDALMKYDRLHFPAGRKHLLLALITFANKSLVYTKDGIIEGFGAIREAAQGYRIGPLFANTKEIAESLLLELTSSFEGSEIFMDCPEVNTNAIQLALKLEMKPIFKTIRMYTFDIDIQLSNIYCLTALEVG